MNCYLEAYHHTLNASQRLNLHQSIVTVMRSRPRFDVEAFYFTDVYGREVKCLEAMSSLQLAIINRQMSEERGYKQLVCYPGKGGGREGGREGAACKSVTNIQSGRSLKFEPTQLHWVSAQNALVERERERERERGGGGGEGRCESV